MPRRARIKDPAAIYHIICRSNSELLLFRNNRDKEHYLKLLKRYLGKCKCRLYGYCLMDNHVHLHLDANGYDISKFMHSLNNAYVWYYNKKYARHGHLFQDRFVSRILVTDVHNLVVSAYIHNNPHDIRGYYGKEEMYEYSSYGIYLGIKNDRYGIVDTNFIKSLFGLRDDAGFAVRYHNFVKGRHEIARKAGYSIQTRSPSYSLYPPVPCHLAQYPMIQCPPNMNIYQDGPLCSGTGRSPTL